MNRVRPDPNSRLYLWPLALLLVVCLGLGWQLTKVRFQPHEDSIIMDKATLIADRGYCPESIPDSLATADVVTTSLSEILSSCVQAVLLSAGSHGKQVQLPNEWRNELADMPQLGSGRAVYRLEQVLKVPPSSLWAIVLPATGSNPAVFVNGTLLGWGGSFEQPVARNAARPLIFRIPGGLLKTGVNQFAIYVVANPASQGFLDAMRLGPEEMLEDGFRSYYFFRATLPQVIALVILVLSFAMGMLWFYRRQDVEYGLCALGGCFWSLHTLDQFVVNIPFSAKLWDWMTLTSVGYLGLTGVFFIHRFLQERYRRMELMAVAFTGGFAWLLLLLPAGWFYPVAHYVWGPLTLLTACYVLYFAGTRAWKLQSLELFALAISGGVILMFSLYDLAQVMGLEPLPYGRFLHFGAPFLLVSFTWILMRRFVASQRAIEDFNLQLLDMNQELEARVEEKTQRIAQSYETIRVLGQEQVLLHERSRIMRDMHDGIGVYLTSMLRQLEKEPVDRVHLREAAHNALNDLRLMIDSLGSASSDLPAMLGMFRTRIGVALDACQVELEWHVDELPVLQDFGPERALNLLRILQEAFTNALKHSGASIIRLSAHAETNGGHTGHIRIEVHDNGKGIAESHQLGNGLKNMCYRAQKIKADFEIDTGRPGTCIVITLPVIVNQITLGQTPIQNNEQRQPVPTIPTGS